MAKTSAKKETQYRVCSKCDHVKSLHVLPADETPGRWGCMHEDAGNGSGGAGSYCSCDGYQEKVSSSYSNYLSAVRDSDIVPVDSGSTSA
jgi:hypothetical protein